ncbi:MAG TPA: NAD(P)/FAD-dependent oxidoreductase [Actinomycetota bacterium]
MLILGGGYVGLYTALGLQRVLDHVPMEITLVNTENFMTYQPFLPEVASGLIEPRHVVLSLRQSLPRVRLLVGEARRIDTSARTVRVRTMDGKEPEMPYDVLVVGAGSRSRVLPIPGLKERAIGFKRVEEAVFLRNRVLSRLDLGAETDDMEERRAALTFVFVGAGYAGVEALAELEDLSRAAVMSIPNLSREDLRWVLVEATGRILPEIDMRLARYAQRRLEKRGIEVKLSTRLESAEGGVMRLSNGERFRADTLVWTAGVKPEPLGAHSDLPLDERGRIRVDACLRVEGLDGVWAAGDAAAVPDPFAKGTSPPTAQHALRQARRLAANIVATSLGGEPKPFRYRNLGQLCSLGRYKGVALVLGFKLKGFPAWFLHRSYHLLMMPTLGKKVRIAFDWTVGLFFPQDVVQLGSLQSPHEPFERAAEDD